MTISENYWFILFFIKQWGLHCKLAKLTDFVYHLFLQSNPKYYLKVLLFQCNLIKLTKISLKTIKEFIIKKNPQPLAIYYISAVAKH